MEINCDSKQTYIFSKCRNYHNYKKTLSEYLKLNFQNQFCEISCLKCKKKNNNKKIDFFYCGKCKNFYCENCKEKNSHIQINVKKNTTTKLIIIFIVENVKIFIVKIVKKKITFK